MRNDIFGELFMCVIIMKNKWNSGNDTSNNTNKSLKSISEHSNGMLIGMKKSIQLITNKSNLS